MTNFKILPLPDQKILASVTYKCKKVQKVQNFFRHFCTEILRISAFFLLPKIGIFSPAKNRCFCFLPKTVDSCGSQHLALVCRTNCREKLQNSDKGHFFFEINKKSEKKMPRQRDDLFFFEITLKPDKKDEKIFGIFTLSLGRSHHFRHFRRR